ncbi:MAG: hypothetical protein OXC11_02270, partial [Rhodospirillales bacterium]|nr:hypothetical protein [Rhodospirillales bacterium]
MRKLAWATLLATAFLSACGDGGSGTPATPPPAPPPPNPLSWTNVPESDTILVNQRKEYRLPLSAAIPSGDYWVETSDDSEDIVGILGGSPAPGQYLLILTGKSPGTAIISLNARATGFQTAEASFPVTVELRTPTCTVGLVLRPGESCRHPSTAASLTINEDGSASYLFVRSSSRIGLVSGADSLIAVRQEDGTWLIEQVGEDSLNRAPQPVGEIGEQTLTRGSEPATRDLAPSFSDPDGDPLTYSAASSDTAVVAASVSDNALTLTPLAVGTATVTVTATDPGGLSTTQTFGVTVAPPANGAPRAVGNIPDQTLTEDGSTAVVDVAPRFEDPDGDALTYEASSSRTGVVRVRVSGSEVTLDP